MNKRLGLLGLCSVMFLSVGCVSLTPEGEMVLAVRDQGKIESCTLKGNIKVKGLGEGDSVLETRNSGADLKGNVVLIGDYENNAGSRSVLSSKAYLCE